MDNKAIETITEKIEATVAEILKTGNSAQKLYLRVRPNGDVDVDEETSWCCSSDEYYKRVPHTLSLEILRGTRDYSDLSENEIEECADLADEAAHEIVQDWEVNIREWVEAGNLQNVITAQMIIDAITKGLAAGAADDWDSPEFAEARRLTREAGCEWDFASWEETAFTLLNHGKLGGVELPAAE